MSTTRPSRAGCRPIPVGSRFRWDIDRGMPRPDQIINRLLTDYQSIAAPRDSRYGGLDRPLACWVLRVMLGLSQQEIADALHISAHTTVLYHLRRIAGRQQEPVSLRRKLADALAQRVAADFGGRPEEHALDLIRDGNGQWWLIGPHMSPEPLL